MTEFLKSHTKSKRERIVYIIIFFWIALGILAVYNDTDLNHLSAYFLSLTGFVTAYIFGESVRQSKTSSNFLLGKQSKREILTYIIIILWSISGGFTIIKNGDLLGMSAYFAALTPFIGSYIIGETYKKEEDEEDYVEHIDQINS